MSSSVKPLNFAPGVWQGLMDELRQRGRGCRESGAFLLGTETAEAKSVETWLAYDDVDPQSLNFAYVRLGSEAFSKLWLHCSRLGFSVVGDVHTHPRGPGQSLSDKANPMISISGHMALIVPRFAQGQVQTSDVSLNVYLGAKRWMNLHGKAAAAAINI